MQTLTADALRAGITLANVSRLDVYLDERPQQSLDVSSEVVELHLRLPPEGGKELTLRGYVGDKLVAVRRLQLDASWA